MPIAAVPNYLGKDFKDASPGMRFGMYLALWEMGWSKSKDKPLDSAKKLGDNDQKTLKALGRRQLSGFNAAVSDDTGLRLEALATAPFTTGLGNAHPLENGFAFLNPYGLPYLPGSGVKGVLRQAARELAGLDINARWDIPSDWNEDAITALFGKQPKDDDTDHLRGALTFWDVIPQIEGDSLTVDIMTPHQSHYYQQKKDQHGNPIVVSPHDSGQPNPITFLTVPPGSGFTFHVTCDLVHLERQAPDLTADGRWKTLLTAAFEHAFQWLGFGAKTSVGYGAMESEAQRRRQQAEADERKERAKIARQEATIQRQAETAVAWSGARIKFNRANGSLAVEKDGKSAIALAPKGKELLDTLPSDIRRKIEGNQFVKVTAYVSEGVLVRIEAV